MLSPEQAHVCAEGNAARKGEDEAAASGGRAQGPGLGPAGWRPVLL